MTVQHGGLTVERWARFSIDQQLLMIANEMHRAGKLYEPADREFLAGSLERVLRLVDLTVSARPRRALLRELLRWRDLVAALYLTCCPSNKRLIEAGSPREEHRAALRALLLLSPVAAAQIPLIT